MPEEIIVNMGQYVTGKDKVLVCLGLGSCIGLALWDPEIKLGGMAHIMLPSHAECLHNSDHNLNKFADIAVPALIGQMEKQGANSARMVAKMAGGAHMFAGLELPAMVGIGERNAAMVDEQLKKRSIKIAAKDVGGTLGRTVRFYPDKGVFAIKTKDNAKEL